MTVSTQIPKIDYVASGGKTFTYPFRVTAGDHLKVYVNGALVGSGYSISGLGVPSGGTVTFTVAPAVGARVTLLRRVPLSRSTDYVEGGALRASVLDDDFDSVWYALQDTRADAVSIVAFEDTVSSVEANVALVASSVSAAEASAAAALASETAAASSAAAAAASAASVGSSEADAEAAATAAAASAAAALASKNAAEAAQTAVATDASTSATNASTASTAATAASGSATAAANSATAAAGSASTAATNATNAGTSATAAAGSASAASTSATNAANSASAAADSATTASTQATNAAASASTASTHATNAGNSATAAASSASAAATSAASVGTSASDAAASATAAAGSATAASTSATNAANSATAAAASADAAEDWAIVAQEAATGDFDGTFTVTVTAPSFVGPLTGNASTATTLQTSRTIGGVSFNGSANINLPGVNTTGNQNTTGSAATLTTSRTINGVGFNGSANINVPDTYATNGTLTLATVGVTSGANYFRMTNAVSAAHPILEAVGSGTNINFDIFSKGTGSIRFNGTSTFVASNGLVSSQTGFASAEFNAGSGAPGTINWTNGQNQVRTLTSSGSITLSSPTNGTTYKLRIVQGGSGSYTITWPTIKWAGGAAPTLSTAVGAEDIITLYYNGTSYYGQAGIGFA